MADLDVVHELEEIREDFSAAANGSETLSFDQGLKTREISALIISGGSASKDTLQPLWNSCTKSGQGGELGFTVCLPTNARIVSVSDSWTWME